MLRAIGIGLAFGGLLAALPADAAARATSAEAALRRQCPTTRNLAPENWAEAASGATLDEWEARIRGPLDFEAPGDATVLLRAFGGGSETQQTPTNSVALVWRDAAGGWRFRKINHRTVVAPPPPPPPGSTEAPVDMERYRRESLEGVLHRDQAAALERLLADPCLDAEPTRIGPQLEVREGLEPEPPCYSGAGGAVQLRRGEDWKTFGLFCPKLLSGELLHLALYPRADAPPFAAEQQAALLYASVEAARAAAEGILGGHRAAPAFSNVTETNVPELRHAPSGMRCRFATHYFAVAMAEAAGDEGYCAAHVGELAIRTQVARAGGDRSVRDALMRFATTEVANDWIDREVSYAGRPQRLDGLRYQSAGFADRARADARDEEYRRVNAVEIDGWILSQVTVGKTVRRAEVDAAAAAAWARLVTERIAGLDAEPDAGAAPGTD